MAERIIELSLPEFAFLEGSGHEHPNVLTMRNVIYHVRTASVLEVLEWKMSAIKPDKVQQRFTYRNRYGVDEKMIIVLHYSATLDEVEDREEIMERVVRGGRPGRDYGAGGRACHQVVLRLLRLGR